MTHKIAQRLQQMQAGDMIPAARQIEAKCYDSAKDAQDYERKVEKRLAKAAKAFQAGVDAATAGSDVVVLRELEQLLTDDAPPPPKPSVARGPRSPQADLAMVVAAAPVREASKEAERWVDKGVPQDVLAQARGAVEHAPSSRSRPEPLGAGDASPRGVMAMYPKVSSSKRRSATSVVAARRGEQRLPSHTRGAVLHGQHARNERRRRLPFAGAARPRRSQTQAHRREAALHAPRERGGCPEQSKQRRGCPCDRD